MKPKRKAAIESSLPSNQAATPGDSPSLEQFEHRFQKTRHEFHEVHEIVPLTPAVCEEDKFVKFVAKLLLRRMLKHRKQISLGIDGLPNTSKSAGHARTAQLRLRYHAGPSW